MQAFPGTTVAGCKGESEAGDGDQYAFADGIPQCYREACLLIVCRAQELYGDVPAYRGYLNSLDIETSELRNSETMR